MNILTTTSLHSIKHTMATDVRLDFWMFQFQFCVDVGFCMLRFYDIYFFFAHSVFVVVFVTVQISIIFTLQNLPFK